MFISSFERKGEKVFVVAIDKINPRGAKYRVIDWTNDEAYATRFSDAGDAMRCAESRCELYDCENPKIEMLLS